MTTDAKTILLVEDDAIIALMEARTLQNEGYRVIHALTGERAVQAVRAGTESIDLILMDIDLGAGMDGTQAAQEIVQHHDIPVVFLSSHTEKDIVERTEKITSYGYVVKDSGDVVLLASINMAFKLHEAYRRERQKEHAIIRSEALFRAAFENAAVGMALTAPDGRLLLVNDAFCDMLGRPMEEVHAGDLPGVTHPEDLPASRESFQSLLAGERMVDRSVTRFVHGDGHTVWADVSMKLMRDAQGEPLVIVSHVQDITERKLVEERLGQSERQYRTLVEGMSDAVMQVNNDDIVNFVNGRFCELTGREREEILGKTGYEFLFGEEDRHIIKQKNRTRLDGKSDAYEIRLRRKDGVPIWVRISGSPVYGAEGRVIGSIGVIADITGRKQWEDQMAQALLEKETLLKELQHRVKNNLNIVSSLLGLEIPKLPDERSRQVFVDAQGRIRAMARIYEQLHGLSSPVTVNMPRYVQELARSLFSTYRIDDGRIRCTVDIAECDLNAKQAVPLGLILNELITNALKHAFPVGRAGGVRISLGCSEGKVLLSVSDDGVGLPEGGDPEQAGSMGLQLIRLLAEQIQGTVHIENHIGTRVSITFPF